MATIQELQNENEKLRAVIDTLMGRNDTTSVYDDEEEFDESQLESIDNSSNKAEGKSGK